MLQIQKYFLTKVLWDIVLDMYIQTWKDRICLYKMFHDFDVYVQLLNLIPIVQW